MRTFVVCILAAIFTYGCCDKERAAYERDKKALNEQINELRTSKETLLSEKDRLTNELTLLGKEKGALSADLKKALDRVEELRVMAEKRKEKLRELKTKLAEMQAQGKLTVITRNGRMIVKLPENVLFDVGKSKLKKEGEAAIAQLAPILTSLEGRHFQVAGHTDSTGKDETNWRLSTDRALEVTLFLINNGMPPERLSAVGYGRFQPVAPNDTDEGRAQNRRIEIVLVPNIEELMGIEDE